MTLQYDDKNHQTIRKIAGGAEYLIPADPDNNDYQQIISSGQTILPYDEPTPTPDDVRAEAQRRMIALIGARDANNLAIKIQNALRETARLLEKEVSGVALTPQEKTRKQTLMTMDAAIEAIRAASNTLEAMTPVPADYTNDSRWP